MKVTVLILLLVIIGGCNTTPQLKRTKGDLNFVSVTENSEFLSANLELSANIKTQELSAEIKFTNTGLKTITITGITVSARGGLRSFPNIGNIKPIGLRAGRDTIITTRFNPVNDINVYQLTGKQGHFKPEYEVSAFFKVQGDEKMSSIDLSAKLPADDYKAYIRTYGTPFIGYSFNTQTSFGQKEGDYLEKLKTGDEPFAFVAQHELALTGINIWMTSLCERDSLYAEILIVSHADYAVKIIPDSINFINKKDNNTSGKPETVTLEKMSGSQKNKATMEKGDKIVIYLKKYFKNPGKQAILSLKHAFVLSGSKPLFICDIELMKVSLP